MPADALGLRALSLYRSILRAARELPTQRRRDHVRAKARAEFRLGASVTNAAKRAHLLAFAEVSLDNVEGVAKHLNAGALFAPSAK
jgi:hypothetical protein